MFICLCYIVIYSLEFDFLEESDIGMFVDCVDYLVGGN